MSDEHGSRVGAHCPNFDCISWMSQHHASTYQVLRKQPLVRRGKCAAKLPTTVTDLAGSDDLSATIDDFRANSRLDGKGTVQLV